MSSAEEEDYLRGLAQREFGFRIGTKTNEAAAMYLRDRGATTPEITARLGGPYLNLLKLVEDAGGTVSRTPVIEGGKRLLRYRIRKASSGVQGTTQEGSESESASTQDNIWDRQTSVYLTSFWGWSPDTWGTVGFSSLGRRNTIVRTTTDPFIVVIYVTKSAPSGDSDLLGKIVGFYLVSHIEGHRNEFTHASHHLTQPEQWQYSLKALRAFSFLPEYRPEIDVFDPTLSSRARAVAAYAQELDPEQIERLKRIPYVEVPVFGGSDFIMGEMQVPAANVHKVKAGPVNRTGYVVAGEPLETEKELYVLILKGDTSAYLGQPAGNFRIFKIGLSLSPKTRLEAFNKTLPRGAFTWQLFRATRNDGQRPYPSFESAEAGENAMKDYLGLSENGRWLGGEFYSAAPDKMDDAWALGRKAALAYNGSNGSR